MPSRHIPIEPPRQRFLRRRTNRRVRKVRRARSALRWSVLLAVNLALLAGVGVAGLRAYRYLSHSGYFDLADIRIEGVDRGSLERLRTALSPLYGRNVLELDIDRIVELARSDPWVATASAKRVLPDALHVRVRERIPEAVALIDGMAYLLDAGGFVIGPSGPGRADDLPVLTGLGGLDGDALAAGLERGLAVLASLEDVDGEWAAGISELELSDDRVRVRMNGAGPVLLLDPERSERNLERFLALRAEILQRVGPADYVDLRWRDRVSVMPAYGVSSGNR